MPDETRDSICNAYLFTEIGTEDNLFVNRDDHFGQTSVENLINLTHTPVKRVQLLSGADTITADGFTLKHAEIVIYIPETSVPSGQSGTMLTMTFNGVDDAGSYAANSTVRDYVGLGQMRQGGNKAWAMINAIGGLGLIGIATSMSYYMGDGNPVVTAERFVVSTTMPNADFENITDVTIGTTSAIYKLPAGTIMEIYGY